MLFAVMGAKMYQKCSPNTAQKCIKNVRRYGRKNVSKMFAVIGAKMYQNFRSETGKDAM